MGYTSDQMDEPSVHLVLIIFFLPLILCSYQVPHLLHQLSLLFVVEYLHQVKLFLHVNCYRIRHHHCFDDRLNDFHFHKLKQDDNRKKVFSCLFKNIRYLP